MEQILEGDCRESLKRLADNSVDSCVTDPPYALVSTLKRFANSPRSEAAMPTAGPYARASAGFMGCKWDTGETAFSTEFWAEVYRVLKPGAFVAAFGATRGYHRMACAIEDAGFEIRDSLMWVYGTGFPKSHNRDGEWRGWGTALKPAFEPIVLARKPLSEGTVAANVLRWRTGALNIDASRVGTEGGRRSEGGDKRTESQDGAIGAYATSPLVPGLGRWPANVVHDGSDEVVGAFPITISGKPGIMRKGTNDGACYGAESRPPGTPMTGFGDSGSAARFFYSAKASKADRAGSKHPTVKPIALMEWLTTLITPPGGTVLDPFAGSGTTGIAARNKGFSAILCEREVEYIADIKRRLGIADRMPWETKPVDFPWK